MQDIITFPIGELQFKKKNYSTNKFRISLYEFMHSLK